MSPPKNSNGSAIQELWDGQPLSATSQASRRSGPQYTPFPDSTIVFRAVCVLPLLVGPTWQMIFRLVRWAGYWRCGRQRLTVPELLYRTLLGVLGWRHWKQAIRHRSICRVSRAEGGRELWRLESVLPLSIVYLAIYRALPVSSGLNTTQLCF